MTPHVSLSGTNTDA